MGKKKHKRTQTDTRTRMKRKIHKQVLSKCNWWMMQCEACAKLISKFGSCAFFYYWSTHFNNNNIDTDQVMWRKHANNTNNSSVLNYYDFSQFEDIFLLFARTYTYFVDAFICLSIWYSTHISKLMKFSTIGLLFYFFICVYACYKEKTTKKNFVTSMA